MSAGDGKQQEAFTFDWWFDRWHPTEEPEIKRLCRIVWDVSRDAARQASQPSHASGESTIPAVTSHTETEGFPVGNREVGKDSSVQEAFQRGQQAMAEKAAQAVEGVWVSDRGDRVKQRCVEAIRSLAGAEPQPKFILKCEACGHIAQEGESVYGRGLGCSKCNPVQYYTTGAVEPPPAQHLTADDARIALQPLMVKQFAWQEAADALNRRLGAVEPPQDKLTGEKLKAIAMKHCTVVAGYEFAERFDFDAIAAELSREPGASERGSR